jgi:hypothetical protein
VKKICIAPYHQSKLGKLPAELQVPNPRMAATFNIGGPICASVCTVLKSA